MATNNWLNLAALLILISILGLYYLKFQAPFKKYRIFLMLVWLATISTVSSICNNALPGLVPIWMLRISHTVYFLAHSLIPPVLLLYVYSLRDYNLGNLLRLIPVMIPSVFSTLLILTNWYSGGLFSLDEAGVYSRGPLMILLYLVTLVNFAAIVISLVQSRRIIPHQEYISVLVFLALASGAVIIQLFFPWLLVENLASALCMMISQMTVQNPEQIIDGGTGMLNKQGFSRLTAPLFDRRRSFRIGFVIVDNYYELEKAYGFDCLESRIAILVDYLKEHDGCIFARLDSRAFCFLQDSAQNEAGLNLLMQDMEENTLATRLKQEGIGIRLQLKTGICSCPQDVNSFSRLVEMLDAASKLPMSRERSVLRLNGINVMRLRRRKQINELVRTAVQDNLLNVVYQPVYSVEDGCFCSAEALLRMNEENLGNISPAEFIPVAEENGAIVQLTQFVVDSVCRFLRTSGLQDLNLQRVHINLSAIDCAREDLTGRILDSVRSNRLSADSLSLEITETAYSSMHESMRLNLTNLSRAGMSIMLDDYGSGYSNLTRLATLPMDVVKLDKSLVDNIGSSEAARIILENTIHMMQSLNKRVLAEGVETKEQADYLIAHGVNYIQGYYYARPMDGASLAALFRSQKKTK